MLKLKELCKTLAVIALFGCLTSGPFVTTTLAQQAPADPQAPPDGTNNFGPRTQPTGQDENATAPAPEIIATHGAWTVQCEINPVDPTNKTDPKPPEKQCGAVQTIHDTKNPDLEMTIVMLKTQQEGKPVIMMRVLVPVGVFLPTGVALEVDSKAVGRVPFTRCLPQVCIAFAPISGETLAAFKKGKAANFIIYEGPGAQLPMALKLDGIVTSLAALDKL